MDELLGRFRARYRETEIQVGFKRVGYVERTARGIDTIFFEQLRNGRTVPSYERTTSTDVVLVLSAGSPNFSFVRMVAEEGLAGRPLDLDDLLILRAWWDRGTLSLEDAARIVQKPLREVRGKMDDLKSRNLHVKRVELFVYDILELKDKVSITVRAPSRLTSKERKVLEGKILGLAKKKGLISRSNAVSFCQISDDQAYRLLQKLVDKGKLKRVGKAGRFVQDGLKS